MILDTNITIKTDSKTKLETQKIFDALGLDIGAAINIFLRQVLIHNGLPFRVELEREKITDDVLKGDDFYGPFDNVKDLMRSLND